MSLRTEIEGATSRDLVRMVCNMRLTCTLTVSNKQRTGRLEFVWGRLVKARATGQVALGKYLTDTGALGEQDLGVALRAMESQKKSRAIGSVLVALGLVESGRVRKALQRQMEDAFFLVLGWKDGLAKIKICTQNQPTQLLRMSLSTDDLLHTFLGEEKSEETPEFAPPIVENDDWLVGHPLIGN